VSTAKLKRGFSVDKVQKEYARIAWFYDGWGRLTEDRALQRLLQIAEVRDGSQILDVGVGTGRLFEQVVRQNRGGMNVGIDLAPAMLRYARKRLSRLVAPASWELQEGSAYDLPFADASFDFLFSTFMLDMLPEEDYPRLLAGFRRVLKPGGLLCLAAFSFGTRPVHRFWYWLARHFPGLLTDCRPVHLEPALRDAGFTIARQEEVSQFTFPSQLILARRENDHGSTGIDRH
jgi:ubiquinone/menaquinone biosynthesis C-methylase UbiE